MHALSAALVEYRSGISSFSYRAITAANSAAPDAAAGLFSIELRHDRLYR